VLLKAGHGVAVELTGTALEGRLVHHAVDVFQHKTYSLRMARARLATVIVRHQVFSQQVSPHLGSTDFAAHLVTASLRLPWGP